LDSGGAAHRSTRVEGGSEGTNSPRSISAIDSSISAFSDSDRVKVALSPWLTIATIGFFSPRSKREDLHIRGAPAILQWLPYKSAQLFVDGSRAWGHDSGS